MVRIPHRIQRTQAPSLIELTTPAAVFAPKPAAILALRTVSIPVRFFGRNTLAKVNFQARPHGSIPNTAQSFPKTKNPTRHRHQTKPIQNPINSRGRIRANSVIEATKSIAQPDALDGLVPVGTTHCAEAGRTRTGNKRSRPLPSRPGWPYGSAQFDLATTSPVSLPLGSRSDTGNSLITRGT